ncbi:hypothetical protein IKQ_05967 [Bacillus cereus VDM053]|nr:hypothetical protein IKQ_05967 [Bacillus cereus VDM053]
MDNDMTYYASLMNYIIIVLQLAIFLMVALLFKGIIIQVTVVLLKSAFYGYTLVTPMYVSFATTIVLLVFFSFELNYKMEESTFNKTKTSYKGGEKDKHF